MDTKELENLISKFHKQKAHYKNNDYKEAELRVEFLDPLLKIFGWDVENKAGKQQQFRNVIQEESIDVEEDGKIAKKQPDYSLRIAGNTKLFIEAKKASIDIENSKSAAFQTKRYGWNANLGISILTNFETLIVYDCRYKPDSEDAPSVARHKAFHFEEYISRIDELRELLSFESVSAGYIDQYFALTEKETSPFDDFFLSQIEDWRKSLALNILQNNASLDEESINFLIQRLLNRIIFLRICEDREIEKYETLKGISNYDELKSLFVESDKKYNSGLFDFIEDNLSLDITLDEQLLIEIFEELYYPSSPYDFSVIDPLILSQIYEQYLGSKIALVPQLSVQVVQEPEVVASNGVVPTPKLVVGQIISETLENVFQGTSFEEIRQLRIADICCGSGTFLITLYDQLIQTHINYLLEAGEKDDTIIYEGYDNIWHLTLNEKRKILSENIYGVDVNPYAVEVTRFSLLLKLLENENAGSIDSYLKTHKQKVLPNLNDSIKCGNSLVDNQFFEYNDSAIENDELLFSIKPFEWEEEFPFLKERGGFDAIVGNPPYVRIQNLVKYSLEEIEYYRSATSPYSVGKKDNFDKYYLFIERAIELINSTGVIGYIVPHKFFIVKGGKKLRSVITNQCSLAKIVHFGVTQVFPGRLTYTAIIVIEKQQQEKLIFKRISRIRSESSFIDVNTIEYDQSNYSSLPWIFLSKEAEAVFNKAKSQQVLPLKSIAEIPVGLQSSADNIYILHPTSENENHVTIKQGDTEWKIEKEIVLPCLYDVRLNLFDTPTANTYIIFPYSLEDGKAVVYSEETMASRFPLCWKYLNHHKAKLEKRSINGSKEPKWYQFGRSQSLTKFHNTDKLIWKVLSTEASYTYDNSNVQFTGGGNGPYYSLISNDEYSIYYILAVLSHPLIEAMVKSGASEFQGAYYSHGKQFIENLPIRTIDFKSKEEAEVYKKIIKETKQLVKVKSDLKGVYISSKRAALERKYNLLRKSQIDSISSLYNISQEELAFVEGDNLFSADIDKEE